MIIFTDENRSVVIFKEQRKTVLHRR